jgi:trimeric autotransporter adhesin
VTLSAPQTTLSPGGTTQVAAQLRSATGATLSGRTVGWGTSNAAVATVSQDGLVTAVTPGQATISATSEGRTGALGITVAPPAVSSVAINPGSLALSPGQSAPLQVVARDAGGTVLTDRVPNWSSTNPAVASVSQSGVVTAVAPGQATIAVSVDGINATATVGVTNVVVAAVTMNVASLTIRAGEVAVLIATPRDANSNALAGRTTSWSTSNASVVDGQVFGDTAVVSGVAPGSALVTATVEGRSISIPVTVLTPQSASVCSQIAGALVIGDDGQYLGRLTNRFDSQSVFNEFGTYGSPYSSTSTNNTYGTYGSPYSSLSANNPYASRPPVLVKNGVAIAYYTVNNFKIPYVTPAYARSCNF